MIRVVNFDIKTQLSILLFSFFSIILTTDVSLARQYGNLIISVSDCYTNIYLNAVEVRVSSSEKHAINYTIDGFATFYSLPVGTYRVLFSRNGYDSNETSVYIGCGQTVRLQVCLTPRIVCNPGEIRSRRCLSSNQVFYEKCSEDGRRWENVTESCGDGYKCENGYCILSKDGWYNTSITKCEENILKLLQEYRKFYCFGSTCVFQVTQKRWINIGLCNIEENIIKNFTCPQTNKDGWYETNIERCNIGGNSCGYGSLEKLYEYRKYYCLGNTCSYQILSREWRVVGDCFVGCPSGYECLNGLCKKIQTFDCNLLDGWYATNEERCSLDSSLCGYGRREIKEEYRDYYSIVDSPKSISDCSYRVIQTRWKQYEQCYMPCGLIFQPSISSVVENCRVVLTVREKNTNKPIYNASLCYERCITTDQNGFVEFYVKPGYYNFLIQKEGYSSVSFQLSCLLTQPTIYRDIYLDKIVKNSCSMLNGWYYTTLTECNIGNYECGPGILLRREEYREYKNITVKNLGECKDYKVVAYRWVEEGVCYKNCSCNRVCSYGFCKNLEIVDSELNFSKKVKMKALDSTQNYSELSYDIILLAIIVASFILLLTRRKKKEETIQ